MLTLIGLSMLGLMLVPLLILAVGIEAERRPMGLNLKQILRK